MKLKNADKSERRKGKRSSSRSASENGRRRLSEKNAAVASARRMRLVRGHVWSARSGDAKSARSARGKRMNADA